MVLFEENNKFGLNWTLKLLSPKRTGRQRHFDKKNPPFRLVVHSTSKKKTSLGIQMKLWVSRLLLPVIAKLQVIHGEPITDEKQEHSLSCYICGPKASWEDCDNHMITATCPAGLNEVCVKMKLTKWVTKNETRDQIIEYSRYCDTTEGCSDKECRKLGWHCSVDCCNHEFCNSNVTMVTSVLFIVTAIFVCLALWTVFML